MLMPSLPPDANLHDVGEFGLIRRFQEIVTSLQKRPTKSAPDGLRLGIGDDAALWQPSAGHELVMTCDAFVEGRHFLPFARALSDGPQQREGALVHARDTGRRLAMANLSDLAAMASQPRFALISLGLPKGLLVQLIEAMYQGLAQALYDAGSQIIGGNVTATEGALFMDVTAAGEVPAGAAIRRSGAQEGDWLGVTGRPGHAAAGLAVALSPHARESQWEGLLRHYTHPTARLKEAQAIARWVHAMTDISDGLLFDLQQLLEAAQAPLGINIQMEALHQHPQLPQWAKHTQTQASGYLFGPSDDYELLFAAPASHREDIEQAVATIGHTQVTWLGQLHPSPTGPSLQLSHQGKPITTHNQGWDHFNN